MILPNNITQKANKLASSKGEQNAPKESMLDRIEAVLKKHNHQFGHLH